MNDSQFIPFCKVGKGILHFRLYIAITDTSASKALRDRIYPKPGGYVYPLIFMQKDIRVKNIKITDVYREEYNIPAPTIHIGKKAVIDNLVIDNVISENHTGQTMPMIENSGSIRRFVVKNICTNGDPEIVEESN